VRSSFGWKWFTCVCLLLGALFRFVWIGDIEYKDDEDGMFHHSQAVGETQLWPTLGMTSGVRGIRHPALGIWSFGILAQVFHLHTPLTLTGSVQALSLVAIALLFWFAWRVVAIPQREVWLWTAALACTNLVAAVYARKIWVPNLLPILCVILLISWWHRQTAPGALLWGITGAVLGQVHMSGFFHAAAMAIGTALFARANVRWRAWVAGSAWGAIPVLPWLYYMWTNYTPEQTSGTLLQRLFTMEFFRMSFDVSLSQTAEFNLGTHFHDYLAYPVLFGVATHGVDAARLLLPVIGVVALVGAAAGTLARRRRAPAGRPLSDTGVLLFSAALTGVLLSLVDMRSVPHYHLVLFPFEFLWIPLVALSYLPKPRLWLTSVWLGAAVSTFGFLQFIHDHCGAPNGDYGVAYRCQEHTEPTRRSSRADASPVSAPDVEPLIRPGQEDLVARMLGRGEALPGSCRLAGGQIAGAVIHATYACGNDKVSLQLVHPSRAPDNARLTKTLALLVVDGSPPAGLVDAVAEHVRRAEQALGSLETFEGPALRPFGYEVPVLTSRQVLLVLVGGAFVLLLSWRWWGPPVSGADASRLRRKLAHACLYAIAVGLFLEAACRVLLSTERVHERIPLLSESAWRLSWIKRNRSRERRPSADGAMGYGSDRFDPDLGWGVIPGLRNFPCAADKILNTNSNGIRGVTEYPDGPHRDPAKTRIVLLGDSFTFGEEVSDDETYAHFLEELVPNSEVINLGVHGFGHDQMLLYLQSRGQTYRPDIVIVGYISLDGERNLLSFRDYAKPRYLLTEHGLRLTNHPVPPPDQALMAEPYRSKLWDVINIVYTTVEMRYTDWRERRIREITRALLVGLRRSVKRAGAIPVFAFLPYGPARFDPEPLPDEREFYSWCRTSYSRCITLRPDFVRYGAAGGKLKAEGHWGPDEHRVAAQAIARYLMSSRLAAYRNRTLARESESTSAARDVPADTQPSR
jgi:hypothetical protein